MTAVHPEEEIIELEEDLAAVRQRLPENLSSQDITEPVQMLTIYSLLDGEAMQVPDWLAPSALRKRGPDGRRLFTTRRAQVPQFVFGTERCFLAEGSQERESGQLAAAGLAGRPFCPARKLSGIFAKEEHARHRHHREWDAFQRYLTIQREEELRERTRLQLEATLALAGRAAGAPAPAPQQPVVTVAPEAPREVEYRPRQERPLSHICDECGRGFINKFSLMGHKKGHEKERRNG